MSKARKLDYYDRKFIEEALDAGLSIKFISNKLGVHPSSIAREIKRNRIMREGKRNIRNNRNTCAHRTECEKRNLCNTGCLRLCKRCPKTNCNIICDSFEPYKCPKLNKSPFVCNNCKHSISIELCQYQHYFYDARAAQDLTQDRRSSSRQGIDLSSEELDSMVKTIKPLLKNGQSLEHIWMTHQDEFPVTVRTFYNYIEMGILDITNLDLPKKVKYKKRKKRVEPKFNPRYEGRSYEDYLKLSETQKLNAVEMDCVESGKGSQKTILTLMFKRITFQIMFLMEEHTMENVCSVFDYIEKTIGLEVFRTYFEILLTDHGHEFNDFETLESSCIRQGEKRCTIYYCDPNRPDQKGSCERNHAELRKIIPKGTKFTNLTNWDLAIAQSHVNSYLRKSLGGVAPIDLANIMLPKELLENLGIEKIQPNDVVLKPLLLPHLK